MISTTQLGYIYNYDCIFPPMLSSRQYNTCVYEHVIITKGFITKINTAHAQSILNDQHSNCYEDKHYGKPSKVTLLPAQRQGAAEQTQSRILQLKYITNHPFLLEVASSLLVIIWAIETKTWKPWTNIYNIDAQECVHVAWRHSCFTGCHAFASS